MPSLIDHRLHIHGVSRQMCLEQQAWFRVCVVSMVPLTFCFDIHFLDAIVDRSSITSSWNLSTNVSSSSSTFWVLLGYQSNSWWEVPSLPLDDLYYHHRHHCLPSDTNLFMLWSSLLSSLCYVLPWSIVVFYVKNVARISTPNKNSWYKWYLLPSLFIPWSPIVSNRKTNNWTMTSEFKTSINPITLKLMADSSFLDYW